MDMGEMVQFCSDVNSVVQLEEDEKGSYLAYLGAAANLATNLDNTSFTDLCVARFNDGVDLDHHVVPKRNAAGLCLIQVFRTSSDVDSFVDNATTTKEYAS